MSRIRQAEAHLLIASIIVGVMGCFSGCTPRERLHESQVNVGQQATRNEQQDDTSPVHIAASDRSVTHLALKNTGNRRSLRRPEAGRPTTSFQILGEYNDRWDLGTDVVIVYFEDHTTNIEDQIESWIAKGYEPWVMFNSSQDYTGAYVGGKYDRERHREEIQRAADGTAFRPFDEGAYLVPNPSWLKYQQQLVKRAIDAGAKAIVPEEPEFFATAGYSPTFKEAWKQEYGTEWVDPNTNDSSRWMARRLMAALYQRHLSALFRYAKTCDPRVKCLVAAHSPFDYAINPMVFPHASVAALPHVDGFVAQVWSDTARTELTDPTRGGKDVEAVFYRAFLEYNYFWNLLRGTNKDLVFLQDPKSDSEGFSWPQYRRWYEQTVVASSLFNVHSFEVMPWPDRFFTKQTPQQQKTSCLNVVQAMRDLRNYRSDYATPYAMLVSDTMLWTSPQLEDAVTWHMAVGTTLLRHGVPIDVLPIERASERFLLDQYRVILMSYDSWRPQSQVQQDALVQWVRRGGMLAFLGGSRYSDIVTDDDVANDQNSEALWRTNPDTQPQDTLFKELGVQLSGALIHTGRDTLVSRNDAHPLVKRLGTRITVPVGEFLYAYKDPSAAAIYATAEGGPVAVFEQKVNQGMLLFFGIPPESLVRSQFGADVVWGVTKYLSSRAGIRFRRTDRISIQRGPYTITYATQDNVQLKGPAVDLLDADLPLIGNKVLAADEYALLYRVDVLPERATVLYSSSRIAKVKRAESQLSFEAAGPFQTVGATTIYCTSGRPLAVTVQDNTSGEDKLVSFKWSPPRRTLSVKYRHASKRHPLTIVVQWENE